MHVEVNNAYTTWYLSLQLSFDHYPDRSLREDGEVVNRNENDQSTMNSPSKSTR